MKPLNILGLIIFFVGLFAIVFFGLYKFFEDSTVPVLIRWGIGAIILGVIILLFSLIKEKIKDKEL